jgi:hypothetical protein
MTQHPKPITGTPQGRELLATAIECLIALLDLQEPDPDLEPNGDEEPDLGWSDMEARYGSYDVLSKKGLEHEHDGSEPSLGWQNEGSQRALRTSRDDREEQCEDEGAQCEDEGAQDDREPDYDNEVDSWPNPMGPSGPVGARP